MSEGSTWIRIASIPVSGTSVSLIIQFGTHRTMLALGLGTVVAVLVSCVIGWACAQETLRTLITHWAEIRKAREEASSLRRLTKAATCGPDRKAADAAAKRKDAAAVIETYLRTELGDVMRITRDKEAESPAPRKRPSRRPKKTRATNVTAIDQHRAAAQDTDGSATP